MGGHSIGVAEGAWGVVRMRGSPGEPSPDWLRSGAPWKESQIPVDCLVVEADGQIRRELPDWFHDN